MDDDHNNVEVSVDQKSVDHNSEIGNISQRVSSIQLIRDSEGKRFQSFRSRAIFTESERSSVSALTAARNLLNGIGDLSQSSETSHTLGLGVLLVLSCTWGTWK